MVANIVALRWGNLVNARTAQAVSENGSTFSAARNKPPVPEKGQDGPSGRGPVALQPPLRSSDNHRMTTTKPSPAGRSDADPVRRSDRVAPTRRPVCGNTSRTGARVLIMFGSKRGGTAGLVDMIADALTEAGCEVIVSPANGAADFYGIDAVIVAGSLYANRWNRHAGQFVRRNTAALRLLPVWLVSSGPLDDSAEHRDIPPTKQVAKLAARIRARGHVTFGGRLMPDAKGFIAHAMAKNRAGDWRDEAAVRRWVESLLVDLDRRARRSGGPEVPR